MARILYVTHQYLPYFPTGVERCTQNVAAQMQKFGHQVAVLSAIPVGRNPEWEPTRYLYEGVEVIQSAPTRTQKAVPHHHWDPDTAEIVASVIEEFQPNLVHVQHPMMYPEARGVASTYGLPAVVRLADYWYLCPRIQLLRPDASVCTGADGGCTCETVCCVASGRERMAWAIHELGCFDAVITPSNFVAEAFCREGFDTSTWIVLASGAFADVGAGEKKLGPWTPQNPLRIRYLGTLLRHKGLHVLLDAVSMIPDAPLRLFIHGAAYHENEYYQALLEAAKDDERVSFEGPYDSGELPELLAASDVVVVPSIWPETQSLVAKAAMAFGIPVICTGPSGMSEIVEACEGGWTVPMGDVKALASAVEEVAHNPQMVVERSSGIQPVLRSETEAVVVDTIYRTLLAG